jgi:DNA-binding GntR family transcriptional regulator
MWMQLQPVGEVVAVRRILEPAAIMAIPAARIEIAAAEVNAIQRRMEKAFNRGALEAAVYAHTEFHLSLVQYAPSRLHRALLASMVKAAEGAQLEILRTPRAGRESLEKHAAIQASLAAGDVANTAELVVAHLTPVFTYFPEAEKLGASDVEFMDI